MKKKPANKEISLTRSSAAEYLTFIAAQGQGGIEVVYADQDIWLTQKMMGVLYDVDVRTINYHLKKIFSDKELKEDSVIQNFRITASDGKTYDTRHYSLSATIAVGYKVNSERTIQFRKWALSRLEEYLRKGFSMDDERLKNPPGFRFLNLTRDSSSSSFFSTSLPFVSTAGRGAVSPETAPAFFRGIL